jgi:RND family efflux transporter MFP subunit
MIKMLFSITLLFGVAMPPAQAVDLFGISKPSAEAAMGFTSPGRVVAVNVLVGGKVKAGDTIAELDGRVLDARIKQVSLESQSSVEVDAAQAELAQRKQELQKITQVHERGAATDLELERAALEVAIGGFRVAASEEKRTMATYRLEEMRAERDLLYLRSPIDGIIEKLLVETGEAPQNMEPVVLVVNCDPLWIEAPVPLAIVAGMKVGDEIQIAYPDKSAGNGKVAVISQVADSASETVLIRIDVPNPEWRRAGERIKITFPDPADNE